jgi:hypothetical protein
VQRPDAVLRGLIDDVGVQAERADDVARGSLGRFGSRGRRCGPWGGRRAAARRGLLDVIGRLRAQRAGRHDRGGGKDDSDTSKHASSHRQSQKTRFLAESRHSCAGRHYTR